jgi:DNA-binding HxlR family transcriptional regulator
MKRDFIIDCFEPKCPIRNVLSRIGDKWSVLIIFTLKNHGTMRFNELKKSIGDISQKMLSTTLKMLEEDGFVSRTVYAEVPPRVEYDLTPRALSLWPHLENLINWAYDHMAEIIKDRMAQAS